MSDRKAVVKHQGSTYEAVIARVPFRAKETRVVLYEVVDGVRVVLGTTQWDETQGRIEPCPADVPRSVCRALDRELAEMSVDVDPS